ncbi:hypothetical protein RQW99_01935 [Leuconostoc falkenbergense]|uniref:hypothetical protein n=1 Tax=Leuconostoc falkenbergense TaxID=2766470 RepID=UPI002A7EB7B5|nr:hypothetical protein [Leuconostoc falkenbergense]MDY5163310.1 hypothetical protein [Leuconostoc falkenbergense]
MKYQKKPVTIEAFQWFPEETDNAPDWFKKEVNNGNLVARGTRLSVCIEDCFYVVIRPGDYITYENRKIYYYKRSSFEINYVKVNDTDRISPDDIGNDIHEFLHGGDK